MLKAGTPLLIPEGAKPIEQFKPGDLVLSRSEYDLNGHVEPKRVEEIFERSGHVLWLHIGGHAIGTTAEHPFWLVGRGWTPAIKIRSGDVLIGHDGQHVLVNEVNQSKSFSTVYNLRVADYHTYFVGSPDWHQSVWSHNRYDGPLPKNKPSGPKPAYGRPGSARWRYERYDYNAGQKNKTADQLLSFKDWKAKHYDAARTGGRPGRRGGAEQVAAKNTLSKKGEGLHEGGLRRKARNSETTIPIW